MSRIHPPFVRLIDLPSRRDVLRWAGAGAAIAMLPGCKKPAPWSPSFFTASERLTLGALADVILPPDDQPGGSALGAVAFIEKLATVYDAPTEVPEIFAGGPFSGRAPFANFDGTPSTLFPENDFASFVALDRVADRAWRLYLYGSDGVTGGGPNDAVLGKVIGLRDQLKTGLQVAAGLSAQPLNTLAPTALANVFNQLDATFQALLMDLVPQAAFAAPEYGGNPSLAGWNMVHYEGDQQPLGYSVFDANSGAYRERPDAPVSQPNPGPDPEPLDDAVQAVLSQITLALGGTVFK